MKKMMVGVLILLGLSLIGCDNHYHDYQATGYIRSIWSEAHYGGDTYIILVEEDNGRMRNLRFTQVPSVWIGMHCTIKWEKGDYGPAKDVEVTRLP